MAAVALALALMGGAGAEAEAGGGGWGGAEAGDGCGWQEAGDDVSGGGREAGVVAPQHLSPGPSGERGRAASGSSPGSLLTTWGQATSSRWAPSPVLVVWGQSGSSWEHRSHAGPAPLLLWPPRGLPEEWLPFPRASACPAEHWGHRSSPWGGVRGWRAWASSPGHRHGVGAGQARWVSPGHFRWASRGCCHLAGVRQPPEPAALFLLPGRVSVPSGGPRTNH